MTRRVKLILELNVPDKFGNKEDCPDSYLASLVQDNIRKQFHGTLNELCNCNVFAYGQAAEEFGTKDPKRMETIMDILTEDTRLNDGCDLVDDWTLNDFADYVKMLDEADAREEVEEEETEEEFTELEDQDDGDLEGLYNETPDF